MRSLHFETSDGVSLRVLEAGPRYRTPAIAFVPGWSMPAEIWRPQLEELRETHHVVALDPRGQGDSAVAPDGYSIDRRAEDLGEFIARYRPVVLVAWSLGALEALHYVARSGEDEFDALVLVDSSVGEEPEPPPGSSFIERLRQDRPRAMRDFVGAMFRGGRTECELARLTELALRMPLESSLALFPSAIPRERWRGIARAIRKPLLYVVTSQYEEQARNLQLHRPETQVAVFRDAGHALFADQPQRFNRLLSQFVDRVRTPPQ